MKDTTLFQYCPKIAVFRNHDSELLLARRQGEADYDGVYSLIGGKTEITDGSIIAGLKREKDEEVGPDVVVNIYPSVSYNVYFVKSSGQHMIVPHHYAEYIEGEIKLSEEYRDFKWVKMQELLEFKPIIENIPVIVQALLKLKNSFEISGFQII